MKTRIAVAVLLALALAAPIAHAVPQTYSTSFTATATNATKSFGFTATSVLVKNDGANEIFVKFNAAATAATTSIYIGPNTGRRFSFAASEGVSSVGVICSAAETAAVTVEAYGGATPISVESIGPNTPNADDFTIVDALSVGGTSTLTGAVSAGSTMAITGNTTVGGTLGITGATTAAAITASGNVTVSNATASRLCVLSAAKVIGSNGAITTNTVPKSASSGASLADSTITDDGTTVTINTATTATTTAVATTGTLAATGKITTAATYVTTPTAQTIADSGDGNPAAGTIAATVGVVDVTCSDADGCALTLSETSATVGSTLRIINVGTNALTIADSAGVQETTGSLTLGANDNVIFCYVPSYWVQCGPVVDVT